MLPKRVIPCLDVKEGRTVKGVEFMDLQDAGDPVLLARRYEIDGADEIVFLDIAATAERRSTMIAVAEGVSANVFTPFTVGGGVRSETDVQRLLDAGADKVAVNSAALADPSLLNGLAARFGSQCIVLAVDVKRTEHDSWQVYAAGGQVATGKEVAAWTSEAVRRGVGEILLTSIDRDGTQTGYDLDVIKLITDRLPVPVIASGGAGQLEHYAQAVQRAGAEAVLAASQLHAGQTTIGEIKAYLADQGVSVRSSPLPGNSPTEFAPLMEKPLIAIVDYDSGNRRSIEQALQKVGALTTVTGDGDEIAMADGIVLPGVGAFRPAMERLDERGLTRLLRRLAASGKPLLGICLGEQLLFDSSEEDGWRAGLGLLSGQVREIETPLRPNIGWRAISLNKADPLSKGIASNDYFYHLHQYAAIPTNLNSVIAQAPLPNRDNPDYQVSTIVGRKNIYGVQFHPEKSGPAGLRLLRNFVELCVEGRV